MHPMTVLPTRRPPDWRAPVLLAAAGLAATAVYLLRHGAPPSWREWRAKMARRGPRE